MTASSLGDRFDMSGDFRHARIYVKSSVEGGPARPIPLQRPPRAEHFTDRERELARLLSDLQPGRVVTLWGPGGIGKTALAAEAVWTLAPDSEVPERFPDGIVFHSFYDKPDPALALEHIALSFGEEPRPAPAEAALRALGGKQALLVLDGTEEAENLRAVLDVRGGCGVLVTSRTRGDALAGRCDVNPLEANDAMSLLRKWGGERAADAQAAARICELVGYLPLGVRLVGRYLDETGETATEYVVWLEETPLEALDQGERRHQSVPVLLEKSVAQVSDLAQQALAVVGLLALAPFDREPIGAALGLPSGQLDRALGKLVSYSLLVRQGDRLEVSHPLVHAYARKRVEPGSAALGQLADYYNAWAREQSRRGAAGFHRVDVERDHVMRVLAACVDEELWLRAKRLAWAVDDYLFVGGHPIEWQEAAEAGLTAARHLGHRRDEGAFLDKLGLSSFNLGRVTEAIEYHKQALRIDRELNHPQDEAMALGNLGNAYRVLGQLERAIEYYEEALVIAREIGDRKGEGNYLGSLGNAYLALGHVETARGYYEQALTIAREIGDRLGEEIRLGNVGTTYAASGQVEQGMEYYEQALVIAREIGHREGEANHSISLGNAYRLLGQPHKAIECCEQALRISREIRYRHGEGASLRNLGLVYATLGQAEKARKCLRQSLSIFEEIKSPEADQVRRLLALAGDDPNG